MSVKQRNRAKNLDDQVIEQIVEILDGWSTPKLTWGLLIEQILLRLRAHYTRQALHNHTRIKDAFSARKNELVGRVARAPSALSTEEQRIARLEAEVARLKRENNNLLEQFNRWVYNGYLKQMDERMRDFMIKPLPPVFRDPSAQPQKLKTQKKQ